MRPKLWLSLFCYSRFRKINEFQAFIHRYNICNCLHYEWVGMKEDWFLICKGPFKNYVTPFWHFFDTFLTPTPPCLTLQSFKWLLLYLEMWNEQVRKFLMKPNLAVKQNFLLPKIFVNRVSKSKKSSRDILLPPPPPHPLEMSRIIWMAPNKEAIKVT